MAPSRHRTALAITLALSFLIFFPSTCSPVAAAFPVPTHPVPRPQRAATAVPSAAAAARSSARVAHAIAEARSNGTRKRPPSSSRRTPNHLDVISARWTTSFL